jgi:hypothetical protein
LSLSLRSIPGERTSVVAVSLLRLFAPTLLVCRGHAFHGMRRSQQLDPTITDLNPYLPAWVPKAQSSHLRTLRQDPIR